MAAATFNASYSEAPTVCVTGGEGFVGSCLVTRLLEKGFTVHATVRHSENEAEVRHFLNISGADSEKRLKLFKGELSEEGSFDAAICGCHGVFHVATPTDSAPNDPEPYMVSKNLAEQAALQYGKEHQDLDVVTINVGFIVGPCNTPNLPGSVQVALSLFTGNSHGLQALKDLQMLLGTIPVVHVDDVCSAHIFLMENPAASGRYICCPINTSVPQLANHLSKRYPQYNVPTGFDNFPSAPRLHISSKKLVKSGFFFKFGVDEIFDDAVKYYKTKGLLN